MRVVAHGDVDAYCDAHGMVIVERYTGKLEEYNGSGFVIVTDNCADKNEYYWLKYQLLHRRVILMSTHWEDKDLSDFIEYMAARDAEKKKKPKRGGRVLFGKRSEAEMAAVRRIFELRDAGHTLRQISDDPEVRYPDGRQIPVSTIQVILGNRGRYGDG